MPAPSLKELREKYAGAMPSLAELRRRNFVGPSLTGMQSANPDYPVEKPGMFDFLTREGRSRVRAHSEFEKRQTEARISREGRPRWNPLAMAEEASSQGMNALDLFLGTPKSPYDQTPVTAAQQRYSEMNPLVQVGADIARVGGRAALGTVNFLASVPRKVFEPGEYAGEEGGYLENLSTVAEQEVQGLADMVASVIPTADWIVRNRLGGVADPSADVNPENAFELMFQAITGRPLTRREYQEQINQFFAAPETPVFGAMAAGGAVRGSVRGVRRAGLTPKRLNLLEEASASVSLLEEMAPTPTVQGRIAEIPRKATPEAEVGVAPKTGVIVEKPASVGQVAKAVKPKEERPRPVALRADQVKLLEGVRDWFARVRDARDFTPSFWKDKGFPIDEMPDIAQKALDGEALVPRERDLLKRAYKDLRQWMVDREKLVGGKPSTGSQLKDAGKAGGAAGAAVAAYELMGGDELDDDQKMTIAAAGIIGGLGAPRPNRGRVRKMSPEIPGQLELIKAERTAGEKAGRRRVGEVIPDDQQILSPDEARATVDYVDLNMNEFPGIPDREFQAAKWAKEVKDINPFTVHNRDPFRNHHRVWGQKPEAFKWYKTEVEEPLLAAKERHVDFIDALVTDHETTIQKGLGIRVGSLEDRLVMEIGEGRRHASMDRWAVIDRASDAVVAAFETKGQADTFIKQSKGQDLRKQFYRSAEHEVGRARTQNLLKAIEWYREKYDWLLDEVNRVRATLYPTDPTKLILRRKDYFRHFMEPTGLEGFANLFETPANIPAELVGISEFTQPKSKFLSFAQRRLTQKTDFSAARGFSNYIQAAGYAVHVDPMIVRLRQFRKALVRETGSRWLVHDKQGRVINTPEGEPRTFSTKGAAKEWIAQHQDKLDLKRDPVQGHGPNNLNNYLTFLYRLEADLAGKTSIWDRAVQESFARKPFAILNWANNRVKANTILGNISTVVAQAFNLPQAAGQFGLYGVPGFYDGMAQLVLGKKAPGAAGEVVKSRFLKERYADRRLWGLEPDPRIPWTDMRVRYLRQPKQFAKWMMLSMDRVATSYIWHSFHRKGIALKEGNPIDYADRMTRNAVAGRGIAEVPLIQKSKLFQLFAPFQLEVGNVWWALQDAVRDPVTRQRNLHSIAMFMVYSWVMNRMAEQIRGNPVSFDPLQALYEGVRVASDPELDTWEKILRGGGRMAGEVLSSVPMGQTLAAAYPEQGGDVLGVRLPSRRQLFGSNDPTRFGNGLLVVKGLSDPLYKLLPSWGGIQAKKSLQGGVQLKRNGQVMYEVSPDDALQVLTFGPYATPEARAYFDTWNEQKKARSRSRTRPSRRRRTR